METNHFMEKRFDSFQEDFKDFRKDVTTELKGMNRKFDDLKNVLVEFRLYTQKQRLECRNENDERYVKQDQFEPLFKKQMEAHLEAKTEKLHKGTQWLKNALYILLVLTPYILALGYFIINRGN